MLNLEKVLTGCQIKGVIFGSPVTILSTKWHGSDVLEITYRDVNGLTGNELLFRDRESELEIIAQGPSWVFDSNSELFRLVSEAYRIRMAYLFDPWMAIHLSQIEPLPHQITAVYDEMIPRQPLRFLLADDPGAGKTIMAGLFIKELMLRGDLQRCLIVTPGNLTEQWQDELKQKFHLPFELLTNDRIDSASSGNALQEMPLVIARLDKLSRDESLQSLLKNTDWDLIIVDEAHKMSASVFNNEISYTKRYHLGELLSGITRHFLLLTATPHNGKEEDFQLFMALLDSDRFAGRYREGVHYVDASDIIRRLVKEQLLKFDGTPLFPERRAYTVNYQLSDIEAVLYEKVTTYVRNEFNRAENLDSERKGTVGFALTVLQRRLASSPEAIYQSLKRRKERLQSRLNETKLLKRGAELSPEYDSGLQGFGSEEIEDIDDIPEDEQEQSTEQLVDLATTARTINELELEIKQLQTLETLADQVRRSGQDRKWQELSHILQDEKEMFDVNGERRKMVIFSEHRDTMNYLANKIRTLLGRPEVLVTIHGGMGRDERRVTQAAFVQDKDILILVATDAAGEGINLQRAHLMINYDLPWNPTRLEQRFGRIHRIGQTEVCHLWNLVSDQTREGDVYARLLHKIEEQRSSLGDGVFDVMGKLFRETSLCDLLIEAIRYGDQPDIRARLFQKVDNIADREHVQELLEDRALAKDSLDVTQVQKIRQEFERAQARRLQPHFIEAFFKASFEYLGGTMHERENTRYEITHVPATIRNRGMANGYGSILHRYQRVTFHKEEINLPAKPTAEFLCPGHPLMDAVIDIILERNRNLLRQGAVLIDPQDFGEDPRLLFYLEQSIQDGVADSRGERRVIARQMNFIEMKENGETLNAGQAPFLDYQPLQSDEYSLIHPLLVSDWLKTDLEENAREYAVREIMPGFYNDVRSHREDKIEKTLAAVKDRLTKEISYWDHRAQDLKAQEQAGKVNARLNSEISQRRADELQARLEKRLEELAQEKQLSALAPVLRGAALIIPAGLIAKLRGQTLGPEAIFAKQRKAVELEAMRAVMENELKLGYIPRDVSAKKWGWDIESQIHGSGKLRFIEVKGRIEGAETITVSKNEILACLNKLDDFYLAVVEIIFEGDMPHTQQLRYASRPFLREPDFAATSVNYEIKELLRTPGMDCT